MSETKIFNEPNLEVVTFDTDFGRFGLMTCFDAMYSHPFLDLVESQDLGIMCLCLAIGVGGNNQCGHEKRFRLTYRKYLEK